MKHGCSTRGVAPASDAAGRGDAQGTPLPTRLAVSHCVVPCGFHVLLADSRRCGSNSGRFAQNRADSGLNRPYRPKQTIRAEIQKKKKKKKGVKRTIWLISKPYFSLVSHKSQNISFHLSSHFVSLPLCALCLSASVLSPLWLWDTQPLGTHSVRCFNSFFL